MAQSLIILALLATAAAAQDYCDKSLCGEDQEHTGCNHNGQFGDACPAGAKLLQLDANAQQLALAAHNEVRQQWANGEGNVALKACRMPTMRWHAELAKLAELHIKSCQMRHDECRNTQEFDASGQNLYLTGTTSKQPRDVSSLLREAVANWAAEGVNLTADILSNYPKRYQGPVVGHATALLQQLNTDVGCAVVSYRENAFNIYLVCCNYATTNFVETPVYTSCNTAAEKCNTGSNPVYAALCSPQEQVNPNL